MMQAGITRTIRHHGMRARVLTAVVAGALAAHTWAQAQGPDSAGGAPALVININTATAAELERLPGIGPSRARAILALRDRLGRFRRVEQLLRVRGIGRRTFRTLRPLVTVDGPTNTSGT